MAAPGTPAGKSPIPPRGPGRVLGDDAVPFGEEPAGARVEEVVAEDDRDHVQAGVGGQGR